MKRVNHGKNVLRLLLSVLLVMLLCGCGGKTGKVDHESVKTSSEETAGQTTEVTGEDDSTQQTAPTRRTIQTEMPEDDNSVRLDFGTESVFGGIAMETDENGELVYTEEEGEIRYYITDKRFTTYRKFSRFARDHMKSKKAAAFLEEANRCFITIDGKLYFVDGANGRTVENSKRYVMDGGTVIRVIAEHSEQSIKKHHVARSVTEFVKVDGVWKLFSLTLSE